MKNLKFLLIAVTLFVSALSFTTEASAQRRAAKTLTAILPSGTLKATDDTTSGIDTAYLALTNGTTLTPFNEYEDVVYSWSIVPSITGTTTGTVIAEGSMSGTWSTSASPISDWVPLVSGSLQTAAFTTTSVSGTTKAWYHFTIANCLYKYVRLRFISSAATQTSYLHGTVYILPHG